MAEKMSGTSVKIIKNEVGCRDDTVPSQYLLVSTVFGTVSSLHPTSFLVIFILVPLIFSAISIASLHAHMHECSL